MQLSLTSHRSLASQSHALLTRRLLPLFITAFSQGLVLWAPIEKVFLKSLGVDNEHSLCNSGEPVTILAEFRHV